MDVLIENVVKELSKKKKFEIDERGKKKIYTNFPIPREHEILWGDKKAEKSKKYGLVITNIGFFIRENPQNLDKKDKNSSYYYFKWEYFNLEDFKLERNSKDGIDLIFNNNKIFEIEEEYNFFKCYENVYEKFVKESVVSTENIFADIEAIIPENYARANTKHGHGEMAEETLTLIDKLKGEKAEVVGRNNKKNGPDRKVNGIEIQTKYCLNGKKSINACFDKTTGQFRYKNSLGETMVIEVPKDQYAEAINEFRKKILENKVPGVTNPNDASKYVKKGKLTYKQALNLCKPGTIESLSYDATTGAINCSFAFGITFLTTYIFSYSRDGKQKEALNNAIKSGIDVFGLSFLTHICAQQVARTNFSNVFIPLSSNFVKHMSPNTIKTIVNSMRSMSGKNAISGAAASKHLAKVLRSNVITSAITFTVFSIPDTYGVFKKNISGAQYTKNMLSLIGSMATAGAGTLATSIGTAKIGGITGTKISPGVGTVIGIVGGLTGGLLGGSVIKLVGDDIREDDTVILSRLFNAVIINLIYEYMLSESEINVVIEKLNFINKKEFKKLFSNVMASKEQEKVIEKFLRHYYEEIIRNRARISEPTEEEIIKYVETDEGEE